MKKVALLSILSLTIAISLTASMCWLSIEGHARLPKLTTRQLLNRQGTWVSSKEFLQLDAIDLNKADILELQEIPGIGPVLSQRIVDYRNEHGYITDVAQLDEVAGIGEITLRIIDERGYVVAVKPDE